MSDTPLRSETPPALSAAAAAEWNRHVESVLRGISHGLNNRAAALAAMVELTTEPAEPPSVLREILLTEQQRVRDLVHAARIIGTSRGEAEALRPGDVVADVGIVLEQHPDLRDGAVAIDVTQGSPIRVPRWAFSRALIALAAGLIGGTRSDPRRIVIATEGDWLNVATDDRGPPETTSPLAIELARHMGGEPLEGRYGIRLPTLATLRRREGR